MTLSYTARLKLAVPDFLTEPWHSEFAAAMDSIDSIIFNALIAQTTTLWLNSTAYVIGNTVINPDSGAIFTCAVAHTSTASPQTFTQELVAHPTFWTPLAPSLATQPEAEGGVENTKYMSALRTAQAIAALTAQSTPITPKDGRLIRTSATQLKFSPFAGNKIKINGNIYDIPTGGIAGLANTGVFVNSVAGQNLAASTVYKVYAQITAGVVTGHFNTVGHRPSQASGNEGVEVGWDGATEFPNLTLIGIIRTNSSSQFVDTATQRFVRTWFNRAAMPLRNHLTAEAVRIAAYVSSNVNGERPIFSGVIIPGEGGLAI
jgi:hypothetical protein